MLHLARDLAFLWRLGTAVQPHPEPEQRIGKAVALLPDRHQVHVFQPRQVVLGRAGRALEPLGDLGERQGFFRGEDVEDALEGAVSTGPMQAQLVGYVISRVSAASGASSDARALIGSAPPRLAMAWPMACA